MSFAVNAYLGTRQLNLDRRVLQRLLQQGYDVEIPPGGSLLMTPVDEVLWLAVSGTPPDLPRIDPGSAFLVGFGYTVADRTRENLSWAPRGVRKYEKAVYSRTSSGTSSGSRSFQYLLLACMAAESNGWCWVDGESTAVSGDDAFGNACAEIKAGGTDIDGWATRFRGWGAGDQSVDPTDVICRPRPVVTPVLKPARKWWFFWR